jgi:hypothetical protein
MKEEDILLTIKSVVYTGIMAIVNDSKISELLRELENYKPLSKSLRNELINIIGDPVEYEKYLFYTSNNESKNSMDNWAKDLVKLYTKITIDYSNVNNRPIELDKILNKGLRHFIYMFGFVEDNCIIDSKTHDFLIPIQIRKNLNSNDKFLVLVNPVVLKSKRDEVLQDM